MDKLEYFTVISYSGGVTSEIEKNTLKWAESTFERYIVVYETGKKGTNPHLNLVFESPNSSFVSNMKKYLLRNVYPAGTQWNKFLAPTKRATSSYNIIGGYLMKEETAKVLAIKGYDLEACKVKALENQQYQPISFKELNKAMLDPLDFDQKEFYTLIEWKQRFLQLRTQSEREVPWALHKRLKESYSDYLKDLKTIQITQNWLDQYDQLLADFSLEIK